MLNNIAKSATLAAVLLAPGAALAANAVVTTDLNIRTGPSSSYQRFDTIPGGSRVEVFGCQRGYGWCDVGWNGERGWVSGNYLAYREGSRRERLPQVGVSIDLPIINFNAGVYQDRHYRGRPWYRDRHNGRADNRRHDRSDIRAERRDVREARRDVMDARRDLRQSRRNGENLRNERRDLRQAQRELRRERRDLRRARR